MSLECNVLKETVISLVILFLSFSYIHNNFTYPEASNFEFDLVVSTKALLWDFVGKKENADTKAVALN